MEKNPEIDKGVAYATATQQAHKVGKSPKKFRTAQGVREAKAKFSLPKKEYQKTAEAKPEKRIEKMIEQLPKEFRPLFKGQGEPVEKKAMHPALEGGLYSLGGGAAGMGIGALAGNPMAGAALGTGAGTGLWAARKIFKGKRKRKKEKTAQVPAHPFEFTLKGMLIKEALSKKKLQQAQRRKETIKATPKMRYESPEEAGKKLLEAAGVKDPGDAGARSAREKARAKGIEQPYTARQRAAGVPPPPKKKPGPKVEMKPPSRAGVRKLEPKKLKPKTLDVPTPSSQTVKKVTKQVSKLRRYGVPIGAGLAGAAALGGVAYLATRKKKQHQEDIDKFWKGKRKTAMLDGLMDELEKISQGGGSLANRLRLGASSPAAQASIQGAAQGNVEPAASAGGGAETPPPAPPPPTTPPSPGGGDIGAPSADPFGGAGAPGGGDPMGGAGGGGPLGPSAGGSPLGGANAPPPPPPPTGGGGIGAGSLLSPKRQGARGLTTEGPP
jgi:hypothetical protein